VSRLPSFFGEGDPGRCEQGENDLLGTHPVGNRDRGAAGEEGDEGDRKAALHGLNL